VDPAGIQSLLAAGPYGFAALCLAAVVWQNKKIDQIRLQQISDVRVALDAVTKSTENINSAEERMALNNEAVKELLAVTRAMMNKGQV